MSDPTTALDIDPSDFAEQADDNDSIPSEPSPADVAALQKALADADGKASEPEAQDTSVRLLVPLEDVEVVYVRELTGRDEEAISPFVMAADRPGLANKILEIATTDLTAAQRKQITVGDRDRIVAKVREVTFGAEMDLTVTCRVCSHTMGVTYDVNEPTDFVPTEEDATYTTKRGNVISFRWPTVDDVAEIFKNPHLNTERRNTLLLQRIITDIAGHEPTAEIILEMRAADRRGLLAHIAEKAPGPRYDDLSVNCAACDSVVPVMADAMLMFQ